MNPQIITSPELFSDKELVCLAKSGNTIAFSAILERYLPVIKYRAGRYFNVAGVDLDDFVQEGMLALFRAVKSFDTQAGIQFKTYAVTCINNSLSSAIKSHMKDIGRGAAISLDGIDGQTLLEESPQSGHPVEDEFLEKEATRQRAHLILDALSSFEQQVLAMYLEGFSYRQISQKLTSSNKSVDNALQRIRRKLRKEL